MKRFHSLKTQFTIVIGFLVLLILTLTASFMIKSKADETKVDIYRNAIHFSNLTISRIMDAYYLYFRSSSYAAFTSQIKEIFELNNDVYRIQIVSYPDVTQKPETALIEYDSNTPYNDIGTQVNKQSITDPMMLHQIRLQYPTFKLSHQEEFYGITMEGFVNKDGSKVEPFDGLSEVENIVYPYEPDHIHSVIFYVRYDNLWERITAMVVNVLLLYLIALAVGAVVSVVLAHRITDPIQKLTNNVLKIATGDLNQKIAVTSRNEIGLLAQTFNRMTDDLALYQKDLVEQEKVNREIQLAAEIQQNLLPKKLPKIEGIDIAAGIKPAIAVGGDVYDFLETGNGDLLFFIGDVAGHGIPASLIASITNALIYTIHTSSHVTSDIAVLANHVLYLKTKRDMFVTMIIARWDHEKKIIRYTCAGHDQIVHYHAKQKKASLEQKGGVALGLLKDVSEKLEERVIAMEQNDVVFLYSDGIPEAVNASGKRYSMKKLLEVVERCGSDKTAEQIYHCILEDVTSFMQGHPQADDVTLIVVKKTVA